MPLNDADNAGADDSAENQSGEGENGDAAGKAGDKSKGGTDDADAGDDAGKVVFGSQKEVDDMVKRRVDRALKTKADEAKLTDTQRLEKERDDALALVRDRDLKDSFISKSGLDFAKGSRIFAMYKGDIEIDDAGKALNLDAVLKTAKAEFPDLFTGKPGEKRKGNGDGGSGNGDDGKAAGNDMNTMLRRATGRQ